MVLHHIHDGGSQGGVVRRVLEKRVVFVVHFVVKDIFVEMRQPDRSAVGNEVNFVPPAGEAHTEFGGYDTRAAIGRVTDNTDFHIEGRVLGFEGCAVQQRLTAKVVHPKHNAAVQAGEIGGLSAGGSVFRTDVEDVVAFVGFSFPGDRIVNLSTQEKMLRAGLIESRLEQKFAIGGADLPVVYPKAGLGR